MYIPLLSSPRPRSSLEERSLRSRAKLARRRGGGGRGGGGGVSRGGSSGGSSGGTAGRASGRTASSANKPPPYTPGAPPPPYSVGGGPAVRGAPGAPGGGTPYTIAGGNAFAGRSAGGGTRGGVYGGRGYGGFGFLPFFPFMMWPVMFASYPYYYNSGIYGPPNNETRPGGPLQSFTLLPAWEGAPENGAAPPSGNAFALYGDHNSVADLVPILASNCSTSTNYGANYTADPFNAVQYYRGDSFVLLLNGYNNSLPFIQEEDENFEAPQVDPATLPGSVNQTYLTCLNNTIGEYIGLIDSDFVSESAATPSIHNAGAGLAGTAALAAVLIHLFT